MNERTSTVTVVATCTMCVTQGKGMAAEYGSALLKGHSIVDVVSSSVHALLCEIEDDGWAAVRGGLCDLHRRRVEEGVAKWRESVRRSGS